MRSSKETPIHVSDTSKKDEPRGTIFDIQRWSLNDGLGIRTLIFLKGCPLRCSWCCNPESQSFVPELAVFDDKCRDCGACERVCPSHTATAASAGGVIRRADCSACGLCAESCIWGAREIMGRTYTLEQVMKEIRKDMVFYRRSGGGVTFSGGEATGQPEFLSAIVSKCASLGVDMAMESCGYFEWDKVADTLKKLDLIFMDIKHMDKRVHRKYTGKDNALILENAIRISEEGIPLVIRIPVIPGVNDSEANVAATAGFVSGNLSSCRGMELLPYHALGKSKYKSLGRTYALEEIRPPSEEKMDTLKEIVRKAGVEVLTF